MTLDDYVDLPWIVELIEEDTPTRFGNVTICYMRNPELPGATGIGTTAEEALRELRASRRNVIDTIMKKGDEVPIPNSIYLMKIENMV